MDGTNRADKADGIGGGNGCGENMCKAFSKLLIVRAILPKHPFAPFAEFADTHSSANSANGANEGMRRKFV